MHSGQSLDLKNQDNKTTLETLFKEIKDFSYPSSEDTLLQEAIYFSIAQIKIELELKSYKLIDDIKSSENNDFILFHNISRNFLETKGIDCWHPFYFFHINQIHLHNKIIDIGNLIFIFLFKTFLLSQKTVSLFHTDKEHIFFLVFNPPDEFSFAREHTLSALEPIAKHSKDIIIITENLKIFSTWDKFVATGLINNKIHLRATYNTKVINTFLKHRDLLHLQAKNFYQEIINKREFAKITFSLSQQNCMLPNPEKKPAPDPALLMAKEIKEYEKYSPLARHKSFHALQMTSQIHFESGQEYTHLLNNYIKKSIQVFQKKDTTSEIELMESKYTIKEFQTHYTNFLKIEKLEEKKAIFKLLQNIMHEFNPLFKKSLKTLKANTLQQQRELESEYKIQRDNFYKLHKHCSEKLSLLNALHKEAGFKQSKSLKKVTIFTKNQSIAKFSSQLSTMTKLIEKITEKDIDKIKMQTSYLETNIQVIDDKIKILQKIFQPPTPRKKSPRIKTVENNIEYKNQDMTSPTTPNTSADENTPIITTHATTFAMLQSVTTLEEKEAPVKPIMDEPSSPLQEVSLFKPTDKLSPSETKPTARDFTAYSYGLLIRCNNNKYLYNFAKKIPQHIPHFSANKELCAQPHISLFFVEDIQLNDITIREKINKELEEILSTMPLPPYLYFTSISIFGVGANENKFLALDIKAEEQLNKIFESCIQVLIKHGIAVQKRYDFKPHVTLGYSKVPITQSQMHRINPVLEQRYIHLDLAVLNRKPPPVKGIPGYKVRTEELQTFTLKIENTSKRTFNKC